MQQTKHATSIAETVIYRLIEVLYQIYLVCQRAHEKIEQLKKKLTDLDANNPDYNAIRLDKRENMKMIWHLVLICISFVIDFILIYQPTDIVCSNYGWPTISKYLVPILLITLEIGIAYSQILHHRSGEPASWVMRNLQYLVIVILIGFSILLIVFNLQGYDQALDGMSFLAFFTGTVLFQLCLLCASILLHLWLIKNAEFLAETVGYFIYLIPRNILAGKIKKMQKTYAKNVARYKKDCRTLVHKVGIFEREHPGANVQFETAMPQELINSINVVMGKPVFGLETQRA